MNEKEFIEEIKQNRDVISKDYKTKGAFNEELHKKLLQELSDLDYLIKRDNENFIYHKTNMKNAIQIIKDKNLKATVLNSDGHVEQKEMKQRSKIYKQIALDLWKNRKKGGRISTKPPKILEDFFFENSKVVGELAKDTQPKVFFSNNIGYGYEMFGDELANTDDNFNMKYKGTVLFILDPSKLELIKRDIYLHYLDYMGGIVTQYNVPDYSPKHIYDFLDEIKATYMDYELNSYEDVSTDHIKYIVFISKYHILNVYEKFGDEYKKVNPTCIENSAISLHKNQEKDNNSTIKELVDKQGYHQKEIDTLESFLKFANTQTEILQKQGVFVNTKSKQIIKSVNDIDIYLEEKETNEGLYFEIVLMNGKQEIGKLAFVINKNIFTHLSFYIEEQYKNLNMTDIMFNTFYDLYNTRFNGYEFDFYVSNPKIIGLIKRKIRQGKLPKEMIENEIKVKEIDNNYIKYMLGDELAQIIGY